MNYFHMITRRIQELFETRGHIQFISVGDKFRNNFFFLKKKVAFGELYRLLVFINSQFEGLLTLSWTDEYWLLLVAIIHYHLPEYIARAR